MPGKKACGAPYLAATSVRGREPHKAISSRAPSPARDGFKPGSSRVRAGFKRRRGASGATARDACAERRRTSCPDAAAFRRRVRKPAAHAGWQRRRRARARRNRTGHTGSLLGGSSVFAGARDGDGRAMGASAHRLRGRGSGRRAVPAAAWCGRSWRRRISVDAEDRRGAPGSSSVIGNRACICICRSDMAPLQSRGGACRSARVSMSRSTAGSVTSTSAGGAAASSARAPVSPSSAASAS